MRQVRLALAAVLTVTACGATATPTRLAVAPTTSTTPAPTTDPGTLPWRHPPPTPRQVRPPPKGLQERRATPPKAQPNVTKATPAPTIAPTTTPTTTPSRQVYATASAPESFRQCVEFRESTNGQGSSNLYGILPSTWATLGLGGSPYTATPAEQTAAFELLYARDGTAPWSPYDGC